MKTETLLVVGEAFVITTQLSVTGEECLFYTCYLTELIVQKASDNVGARTRTLRDKVSSSHAFFSSSVKCKDCFRWYRNCNMFSPHCPLTSTTPTVHDECDLLIVVLKNTAGWNNICIKYTINLSR